MSTVFTGTAESLLKPCLDALRRARAPGIDGGAAFRTALQLLLGVHQQQAVHGALAPAALAAFRAESLPLWLALHDRLPGHLDEVCRDAWTGNGERWHALCARRSELQFLIDDYPGSPLAGWLDGARLREIDGLLHELAARVPPVPADEVPDGMPATHWWWQAGDPEAEPAADDGFDEAPDAADDETAARDDALALAAGLTALLEPLLAALSADPDGTQLAALRPQPGDCARVFEPPLDEVARQAYETLWAQPPKVAQALPGSRLEIHVAPAGLLLEDNALSRHFPGGYRRLAAHLEPSRVWVAWKVIERGAGSGMAYDGLVWIDDHWAWFPKPFRVLRDALDALDGPAPEPVGP